MNLPIDDGRKVAVAKQMVPGDWFRGKNVLVTGGVAGLGLAMVTAFGRSGANVTLIDRDEDQVRTTVEALAAKGIACTGHAADVRDREAVSMAVRRAHDAQGPLSICVANAGIYPNSEFLEITEEEWDRVLDTNVKGVFLTAQAATRSMVEGHGGMIITISSGAVTNALPGWSHYSASKAAVLALTRSMALELAPLNIRVNCILPGYIDVEEGGRHLSEQYRQAARSAIPLGRPGRPEDIANAAMLLASPLADFITGAALNVDGGSSLGKIGLHPTEKPAEEDV